MHISSWSNVPIVVTGGLGFIGSSLAKHLVELGAKVVLIDNLNSGGGGTIFNVSDIEKRVTVKICDINHRDNVAEELRKAKVLFNLAARTSHQDSMENPISDAHTNCLGQLVLLDACRKLNPTIKIVFGSTRQIYGKPKYLPVDEHHPLNPIDVNGINKMAGEQYHFLYSKLYGMPVCSVRLTNTYGPGMRIKDARQNFFGLWMRLVLENKPFSVWGGEQLRDLNYVDDAVEALTRVAESGVSGAVYNAAGPEIISLRKLADILIAQNGSGRYEVEAFPPSNKQIDVGDYYGSSNELSKLGWWSKVSLNEGIRRTLDYFRSNLNHYL